MGLRYNWARREEQAARAADAHALTVAVCQIFYRNVRIDLSRKSINKVSKLDTQEKKELQA
ncbi:hypothetical protein LINGRAHAP2_LOCUS29019 [Linum grandiflorum]